MDVKFPYKYVGDSNFGKIYRPVAKVSFQSPKTKNWTSVWMIVDTGADFTILPKYLAVDLHINLKTDCQVDNTAGVGGIQKVYLYKNLLTTKIGDLERKVPLAFFDSDNIPPLLGRLGFLETFNVKFLTSKAVIFSLPN